MPEGDTVLRTARRLHAALAGDQVTLSDLRWPTVATVDLAGARTLEVCSRGKHILHRFDTGLTLHSHLRMEGSWRIERSASPPRGRRRAHPGVRVIIETRSWTASGIRLGMLDLIPTTEEDRLVGHLGPDVLGPDWDVEEAVARLSRWDGPVGAALLDQRNLAGVGTFWAAEGLFLEGLDPWTAAADLDVDALRSLAQRLHRIMRVGAEHGVQSSTGIHRHGHTSYVHGRAREACRRCGGPIRVAPITAAPSERVMFCCPTCQPASPA